MVSDLTVKRVAWYARAINNLIIRAIGRIGISKNFKMSIWSAWCWRSTGGAGIRRMASALIVDEVFPLKE